MNKIMVIANDKEIATSLDKFLTENGYSVHVTSGIMDAKRMLLEIQFNLFILDITEPHYYELGTDVPILFLCDIPVEGNFMQNLALKSNDYIIKPFRADELKRKINTLLKNPPKERYVVCGDLKIDVVKQLVTVKNKMLSLGKKERELLILLARKTGQIVTQDKILSTLGDDDKINTYINELRKKLRETAGEALRISSYYGGGYRLEFNFAGASKSN
jgi:DNA-binding response OmpR family regulator